MAFCHTHLHGEFSLLDGCGKGEDYAARAEDIGQSAVALTDHGNLAGALYHAQACQARGVKPIIGMEAYFEPVSGTAKGLKGPRGANYWHLLLIAKTEEGFRNLMRLSSAAHEEARRYYDPIIDFDLLSRHSTGLISSTTCISGYIPELILDGKEDEAEEALDRFLTIFGDDFYLEIQPHDITFDDGTKAQHVVNEAMVGFSKERGLPLLATIDTHYPDQDWQSAQDTVILLSTGNDVNKREKAEAEGKRQMRSYPTTWMMTEDEVTQHFMAHHSSLDADAVMEAMENTGRIADSVWEFAYDRSPKVPKATESPEEAEAELRRWCVEGLERLGKTGDRVYEERVEEELALFGKLGVLDYFVIIGRMVRWAKSDKPLPSEKEKNLFAKKKPIRVGACRGSAGASLVLYLSRVTAIDPIGYDLLFQRFMNEFRTEMPDVDIDFASNRVVEVRQYLIETYGQEKVADVGAFQSFGMKSVIKDTARARGLSFEESARASKDLEDDVRTTLEAVVNEPGHENLADWRDGHPEEWQIALKLEGQIKTKAKHAAAVVITDRPVSDLMPTMNSKDGSTVTQWSERANAPLISTYGFLKIDLLATEGLTVQQEAIDLIKERHGIVVDFEDPVTHPEVEFPIGEQPVCERFTLGQNLGIFQFGSGGILRALREIKPTTIDDLIAVNAMFRPGPMKYIADFAARKNGKQEWELPHEKAEPILGRTYGIIAFQEQVMRLCITLADFEPSAAGVALKVIAKGVARDKEGASKLDKHREEWLDGTARNGISKSVATAMWQAMLEMASYSFNRSHAAGYALQAYQDAWIKHHYGIEFYAGMLKWDEAKKEATIREARANGIRILPPDINDSDKSFRLSDDAILFGLIGIKNVGTVATDHIFEMREEELFGSLEDFDERIVARKIKAKVNSKVRGSLLGCGAFDLWGCREEWTTEQKGEAEKELIGFSPSMPSELALYKDFLEEECELHRISDADDGAMINIAGEVVRVKQITKKGNTFAFVTVWYDGEEVETFWWTDQLQKHEEILHEGSALLIHGEWQEERHSIRVMSAMSVSGLASAALEHDPEEVAA